MKHNKLMLMLLAGSMILGNCGTILHAEETEEQFCMITEESGSDLTEADMEEPAEDESVLYAADLIEDDSALYAGGPIDDDIQLHGVASNGVIFDYINSTFDVLAGESATVKVVGSNEGDAFVKITDVRTPDGESIPMSERERLYSAEVSGNSLTVSTRYVPDIPDFNIYVRGILTVGGSEAATTYDPMTGGDAYIKVRSSVMGIELEEYPRTDELPLVAGREYILTPHLMRGIEGFSTPANYLFRITSNDTGALEVSTDAEPYDASYIMINGVKTKADGQLYRGGTGFTVKRTSNTVLYNAQTQLTLTVTAYKHVAEEEAWAPDKSRDYHFVEMFGDLNFSDSIDITKDSRNSTFIDEERFNRFRETLGDEYVNISYNITTGEYVHDLFVPDTTVDINGLFSYDPSKGELRATGTAGQLKGVAGNNEGFHVMVTGY
ncbi:MAG: hypothetical protein II643_06890, partial [Oscillospiraceae bacterium]|nr:hypothetical protein [Oscillospiraceae bacterium]